MKPFFAARPFDYYMLWFAVILSLGINVYLINVLVEARRQVAVAAGTAASAVGQLRTSSIDYPVEISETLPISLTLDYKEDIQVPISVTVPINTQISVPLRTPLGTFPINVPVNTNIPISLTTVVPLDVSIPISLTVPVNVAFPIRIDFADTALGESLSGAELYLQQIATELNGGVPPVITTTMPAVRPTATP